MAQLPQLHEARNGGTELDLDWVASVQANTSAIERRAATLPGRRSVKEEYQAAWLLKAISCIDLTTLAVRDVIVLGMPAGQPVARSLLQHLFAIAGAHQCGAIRVDLSKSMKWMAREWSDPQGELFRFPVICFLPGSTTPVPPGATWQTQPVNVTANCA